MSEDLDDDFGGPFAELEGALVVWCPYCGEPVELLVDPGGGEHQEYVEDCEVCCSPWRVELRFGPDGTPEAELSTLE